MGITDKYFSQYFGFTEDEVKGLLKYCGCGEEKELLSWLATRKTAWS
jgi:hypothetical protein